MLELHCHTTHSDGTLTPTQLVEAAIAAGVRVLAITDHDTVSAWDEAFMAARQRSIEIVPGLELSTLHQGKSMHILGFYPDQKKLSPALQERLQGRQRRAEQMIAKLAELGYPIELSSGGGHQAIGRPHIAAALVQAGYVQSHQEAFDRWLGDDKPAYVDYPAFTTTDGIHLLRDCGAVPVWAHPCLFRGGDVETVLPELVEAGLMGIEVYHPSHTPSQCQMLTQLCQQYGLLMTGGSDYHGVKLGEKADRHTQLNQLHLPEALLAPLQRAAFRLRQGDEAGSDPELRSIEVFLT
jgi:3',5'-nucleoside bisphosphate phosphatase